MATLFRYFSKHKSPKRTGDNQDVQENEEGSRSDSTDRSNIICDSIDSLDKPPVAKRRKHVFMESWKTTRPWLQVDSKNKCTVFGVLRIKESNVFTIGCTNFQTSTLNRHVALPSHKEAINNGYHRSIT